VTVTDQ